MSVKYTVEMAKALAEFQSKVEDIDLDGEVKFKGVNFKYATLANIVKKIKPTLKEVGLAFTQFIEQRDGANHLVTSIICVADGSSFESSMPMNFGNDPKAIGGNITYFKRYNLCAALGIVAEDDKDHENTSGTGKPALTDDLFDGYIQRLSGGGEDSKGLLEKILGHFNLDAFQIRALVHAEDEGNKEQKTLFENE